MICNKLQPICNWRVVENKKIQQQRWGSWIEKYDEKQCKWKWSVNVRIEMRTSQLTQRDNLDILDWVGEVKWCALNNHIYDVMTRMLQHFKGQNQETTFWKRKNVYVHDANQTSYALSKCENSNMSNIKQKYQ